MGNTQTRIAGFSSVATAHSGGVFIRAINQENQKVFDTQMTSAQDVAQIPNGTWQFNIISFNGPSYMKGTKNCGS